jgi:hypothetical protein
MVEPGDVDKIRRPEVTTERRYQAMHDLFGDILTVRKVGCKGRRFAPWDELIRWRDVQEAMFDLVERPDMASSTPTCTNWISGKSCIC